MNPYRFAAIAVASLVAAGTVGAQSQMRQGTCCWRSEPLSSTAQPLPENFSARVDKVEKPQGRVIMTPAGKQRTSFAYDSTIGTAEQRRLLDTLKPGDEVRGTRMNVDGATRYHFDRTR